MSAWFVKKSPQSVAVEAATVELKNLAEKRKSAMERLVAIIQSIPLDSAISDLGKDLTDVKRNGQ